MVTMKNLEIEYKKLTEENVPDLWDRIEAGIDKLEAEKSIETTIEKAVQNDDNSVSNNNKKVVNIRKKKSLSRIVPIIAAAAALVLSCGLFMMKNSNKSYSPTVADVGYEAAAEMAMDSDYGENAAAEAYEENVAAEAPVGEVEAEDVAEAPVGEVAAEDVAEAEVPVENAAEAENVVSVKEESGKSDVSKGSNTTDKATIDGTDISEYYGQVTLCDNTDFVIISENGNDIKLYVPEEFMDTISEAVRDGEELQITYEKVGEELRSSFPKEYENTAYQITKIKK